jgi:predicted TPR repeat methyltransferase
LGEARKRALYADLVEGDLESMAFAQPFSLAVAADVLIYLGDLGPTFAAIDRALAPGGAILFSVEELPDGGTFRLTDDLRYAHAHEHIRALAAAQGWTEIASEQAALRRQGGKPVAGILFLFRK